MKLNLFIASLLLLGVHIELNAQWELKHLHEKSSSNHNVIKFKNDSVGLLMGPKNIPLAGNRFTTLKTEDSGETWREIELNIHVHVSDFQFISDSLIYAVGEYPMHSSNRKSKFIFSHDLGETWDSIAEFPNQQLRTLSFFDSDTGLIAGYDKIYRTIDSGNSWHPVWDIKDLDYSYGHVSKLSLQGQTGYAIGEARNFNNQTTGFDNFLLKTTNCGITWDSINTFPFELSALYFLNTDTGFVGSYSSANIMHKTTDGGQTWAKMNMELPNRKVNSIHFPSKNKGYAVGEPVGYIPEYGGSSFFISKTTDGGANWETFDTLGLPLYSVYFTSDTVGYVAGSMQLIMKTNGGISKLPEDYPWDLIDVSVENHQTDLSQTKIYPNPANGIIHIESSNSHQIQSVQLISPNGSIINTLENNTNSAPVQMNISRFPAGMYFIRIAYPDKVETLKVLKHN